MAITAALVKELRERTGVGMMECKKVLVKTDGDIEAAIEELRKSGHDKASKKAGRVTTEGTVVTAVNEAATAGVILEILSETDFVARDEQFQAFANAAASTALAGKAGDVETLSSQALASDTSSTVEQARQSLVAKLGENIQIRRVSYLEVNDGTIATYNHGGRIGVMLHSVGGEDDLGKNLAMHVAASRPEVVNPEDVAEASVTKEKEIFEAQAASSGKPAEIIAKMVEGRIKKFVNEVSLLGQPYVKEPKLSVKELLEQQKASVKSFVCFEVGEGIEKKVEDFAAEVMAQVEGNA